jgi:acetylglutamate kinase
MRVVVKIGGSLMDPANASAPWLQEVQRFRREGHQLVLVHGGGPMINQSLIQSGVAVTFYQGQRVTTPEILAHVVRVLRGVVNAELVVRLQQAGIVAAGISGLDAGLFAAEHLPPEELGLVGRIVRVDPSLVHLLWSQNIIPVVAPRGGGGAAGGII